MLFTPKVYPLSTCFVCCVWLDGWGMLWCVCILSLPIVLSFVSGYPLSTHYCNCKKNEHCSLFIHGALRSSLFETCPCITDRIGIWKCWFLRRGENWSTWRKISRRKGENQKQTQPTYGVDAKIPTRATLVGMSALTTAQPLLPECSHEYGCSLYFYLLRSICTVTQRVINFMHAFFGGYEFWLQYFFISLGFFAFCC